MRRSLPAFWQKLSFFGLIFQMRDGIHFGFFVRGTVWPWLNLSIVGGSFFALSLPDCGLRGAVSSYGTGSGEGMRDEEPA